MSLRACLAAAAMAIAIPAAAQTPNINAEPTFRTIRLAGGFTPDPFTIDLQSGGSLDAGRISGQCRGFIAQAPDVRLHFNAGSLPLIISVASDADTTLVVNAPDGSWYCDDDSGQGTNPSIRLNRPQSGRYEIWVGTYGNTSLQPARLNISELYSQ